MKKYIIVTALTGVIVFDFLAFPQTLLHGGKILKKAKNYQSMIPVKRIRKIRLPEGYHEGLFIDGDNVWVNNGKGGKTWVVNLHSGRVVSEIEPVAGFSEGITSARDGKYWITDWTEKKLYRVTIEKGKMTAECGISLGPARPTGVIRVGKRIFVITWTRGVLGTRYHLLLLDGLGNILDKIGIENISEPSQMAWDGAHLWITSWFDRRAYKVDIEKLEIKGYFRPNVKNLTGIAWDGKSFWVTGTKADLYQIEI